MSEETSVYVACLAAYNAGHLHGEWIDLSGMDRDDFEEAVEAMLERSPIPNAEEWAVHDYGSAWLNQGEYPDVDSLLASVEAWETNGEAWEAYVELLGDEATQDGFEDAYAGNSSTFRDWVEEWIEDVGYLSDVPEEIKRYFDYDAFARDMEFDVQYEYVNGTCYVFHNH